MSMKDRVVEMKEEVENLKKEYQENSLATEMLRELKAQNKRQHITIIVLIAVIVAMIIGFFIFANQFELVGETEQIIETNTVETKETDTEEIEELIETIVQTSIVSV